MGCTTSSQVSQVSQAEKVTCKHNTEANSASFEQGEAKTNQAYKTVKDTGTSDSYPKWENVAAEIQQRPERWERGRPDSKVWILGREMDLSEIWRCDRDWRNELWAYDSGALTWWFVWCAFAFTVLKFIFRGWLLVRLLLWAKILWSLRRTHSKYYRWCGIYSN